MVVVVTTAPVMTENTGRVIWLLLWAGILERQAGRLQKYR